ncbi:hypothetical protein IEE94_12805 [Yimella sp. cx-573]|nr:hypothetical protein [Yimella sp. cx-573]
MTTLALPALRVRTPGDIAMRTVFRMQAVESQLALVASWLVVGASVSIYWFKTFQASGSAVYNPLVSAITASIGLALLMRIQLAACRGGARLTLPWAPAVMAALTLIPMYWGILSITIGLSMVAIVLALPPRKALVAFGLLVAGYVLLFPRLAVSARIGVIAALLETAIMALMLVTVTRMAVVLDELRFTAEVMARRRVDVERERIGRDLHDLMGRTLVAASLRNQTALRTLGDRNPELSSKLEKLHETISRGQVELRALTSGPTIATLDDELDAVRMLCERVDITIEQQLRTYPPSTQEAVVGLVIRESITNILKHTRASLFSLTIDRDGAVTTIDITNDGADPSTVEAGSEDAMDSRLARAVTAAGGTVRSGMIGPTTFRTSVRLPLPTGARS